MFALSQIDKHYLLNNLWFPKSGKLSVALEIIAMFLIWLIFWISFLSLLIFAGCYLWMLPLFYSATSLSLFIVDIRKKKHISHVCVVKDMYVCVHVCVYSKERERSFNYSIILYFLKYIFSKTSALQILLKLLNISL